MLTKPQVRNDTAGSGEYGSSRGRRTHRGIDYLVAPGDEICSHIHGRVTKLGYPYGDDLTYRYVEVTCLAELKHRFFYVEPSVAIGDIVAPGEPVGVAQDITARYPDQGMLPHCHYEVKMGDGYINPDDYPELIKRG